MREPMIQLDRYEFITFDCYGTLVDWSSGILAALGRVLEAHGVRSSEADILELYSELEARVEDGPFIRYRQVQERVVAGFGERLGFEPSRSDMACLADSMPGWAPFPDTVESLRKLKQRYGLGVISNVDDDLFAQTQRMLGVEFDHVVTAQQVRSYKPSLDNFRAALERIGLPTGRVLHAAQSLRHDIAPAKELGLAAVWVNRRKLARGAADAAGSAGSAGVEPDAEVPDLASLVSLLGHDGQRWP